MKSPIDLSTATYGRTRSQQYDIVLLPWGATEPHNLHLPYLTDCILSHGIALDAANAVYINKGVRCMVLPPVNMGAQNPGQRQLPFCIHARYETQKAILTDIVASLYEQGFRKMLIVNGHGGNVFKPMIRDLLLDYPDFIIASSEWYKMARPTDYFEQPGEHADEIETSVMMHYHPELVHLDEAGEGNAKTFSLKAMKEGKVWVPRDWSMVTTDTGIGNPMKSTAEKGKRFAEAVVQAYVDFLCEFTKIKQTSELYL
ncbi:MAG: creatininase family protein [Prevotella sp.]|nr:creatininase family protein [Prevotella sp.]MBQ6208726.1 creatininase family protein [Prevotella sp.]